MMLRMRFMAAILISSLFLLGGCSDDRTLILDSPDHIFPLSVLVSCNAYSTATQVITNTSSYDFITFENVIPCVNIDSDTQNFSVLFGGTYHVTVDLFVDKKGGVVNTLEAIILLNGVQVNGSSSQNVVNSDNEVDYFAININLDLVAGDVVSVGVTSSSDDGRINGAVCILCDEGVTARFGMFLESGTNINLSQILFNAGNNFSVSAVFSNGSVVVINITRNDGTVFQASFLNPDNDTHVKGNDSYLYNDSAAMYFNDTKLNETIKSFNSSWDYTTDTDTHAKGNDSYLYNDSSAMYLNETKLNNTIDEREIDTHVKGNDSYLYNDSTAMYLNETTLNSTIDEKLSTTFYNASTGQAIAGTIDGGSINDTRHNDGVYDGVTFNFSEVALAPGLDMRINFTNITGFNRGIIRYRTSSLAGDYPIIQMWNYDASVWEDYPNLAESATFATITQPVFDSAEHILNGTSLMRLYKATNGNINNHYFVDWIAISDGPGTPSGQEVDPFSIYRDGSNSFTNNFDAGAVNFSVDTNTLFVDSTNNNVGIGTITPSGRFEVNDGTYQDFIILDTGEVGIGLGQVNTTPPTPEKALDISGDINIVTVIEPPATFILNGSNASGGLLDDGAIYDYRIVYYTSEGDTQGSATIRIDLNPGQNATNITNIPISADPRVIGRKVYRSNGGGSSHIYYLDTIANNIDTTYYDIKSDASLDTTDDAWFRKEDNTVKGFYIDGTLFAKMGYSNAGYGRNALTSITSGANNHGFGSGALSAMATGTGNVGVGEEAFGQSTASFYTTGVGFYSGRRNLGSYNACLGGYSCSSTTYQTFGGTSAVGYGACQNSLGNFNVCLGYNTGKVAAATVTGAYNVFIGYSTGDNIGLSADSNILIGNQIDLLNSTDDGQLSIGNLIFGTGIDGTGTTISTGNIGIKNPNPQYPLEVNGSVGGVSIYAQNNISAEAFIDRTSFPVEGYDALSAIMNIKSGDDGKLNHSTLGFAKTQIKVPIYSYKTIEKCYEVESFDEEGDAINGTYCYETEVRDEIIGYDVSEARSVGGQVSENVVAIQQQQEEILINYENVLLIALELCEKTDIDFSWCV